VSRVTGRQNSRVLLPFHGMPLYHFAVRNSHSHDDPDGTELADDEAAREAALQVIRDLKKNSGTKWNGWTIEVNEGERAVWRIAFIGAE
jgi:hypothetical protein